MLTLKAAFQKLSPTAQQAIRDLKADERRYDDGSRDWVYLRLLAAAAMMIDFSQNNRSSLETKLVPSGGATPLSDSFISRIIEAAALQELRRIAEQAAPDAANRGGHPTGSFWTDKRDVFLFGLYKSAKKSRNREIAATKAFSEWQKEELAERGIPFSNENFAAEWNYHIGEKRTLIPKSDTIKNRIDTLSDKEKMWDNLEDFEEQ